MRHSSNFIDSIYTGLFFLVSLLVITSCSSPSELSDETNNNPFFTKLNEPIDYANATADDLETYAIVTMENVIAQIEAVKSDAPLKFDDIFISLDDAYNKLSKASSNCHTLYWVSPDSLTRVMGLKQYEVIDSLWNQLASDKMLFVKIVAYSETEEYKGLIPHRKKLVDDMISDFKHSGINLESEKLEAYKTLNAEITELTSKYSINMNTSDQMVILNEAEADGLPDNFKNTYRVGEGKYEIPAIPATSSPVMSNAKSEAVRKAYLTAYYNRGVPENLEILDQLIQKRYEISQIMGYNSYADYNLVPKMAGKSETVWNFINDLIDKSKDKAIKDLLKLKEYRNEITNTSSKAELNPWDIGFYKNQLLKNKYQVDHEKIREYLPMESCLEGMLSIYQQLLGYEFRKVENPSVWHEDVTMYEVYEGNTLRGIFYLDLYPRPNKESWFYGVGLKSGRLTNDGYEVPVKMLLGNFSRPTDDLPSLISFGELETLFHEFGHIMDGISYQGEFVSQADSKRDFVESMSQIFENWIWDYGVLSSLSSHYQTGEKLPKETFDNMLAVKNITSGLSAIGSLRYCTYDMNLYDKYDPSNPISTDDLWKQIDKKIGVQDSYIEGTHPQASWIHINTHPVYMYGYLWSEVFAQDMFTEFKKNGLLDQETGIRYRNIILANGSQREVLEAVEEFLGRPSNNEAYIKSLGLE